MKKQSKQIKGKKQEFQRAFAEVTGIDLPVSAKHVVTVTTSDVYDAFKAGVDFALKQKPAKVPAVESNYKMLFPESTYDYAAAPVTNVVAMDQPDLQFTTYVFRELIASFEENIRIAERTIAKLWNVCDPENPASKVYFDDMNRWKDIKRELQGKLARMQRIQSTLKKAQRQ